MTGPRGYDQARSISLDFDGVLSTLVLGRAWEKTRAHKKRIPVLSPLVHGLKTTVASLTEGFRRPFPQSEDALRELRASQRKLYVLTSRTGERVPAAERWLEKFDWQDIFERRFFNLEGEDADRFKARILRSTDIDVHVDDDSETLSYLSREFPERLFVHMNCYHRKSPAADNVIVVHSWEEIPGIFGLDGLRQARGQNEKARPA
ncbi:MAG: HAD family hydrolase [Candidatus Aminicenantales bacterium]